jgi:glycosidase
MSRRLASVAALLLACATPRPPPASEAPVAPEVPLAGSLPGWAEGAVFYEVFVRSYQDSDGDGKGDLRGLVARLDYLNDGDPTGGDDLGVDALWLMPVFESPSYHGYDTTDYEHVARDYGTDDDFALLVREAHRRGIRVIVDLVLNHTSREHPWFKESASSPTSPRRDWYVWSPTNPHWTQPWNPASETWHPLGGAYYYGLFWAGMPDLNLRTPAVREELKRIAALWLGRGVDGFRLDAVRHLVENGADAQVDQPETHAYLKEFAAWVRSVKPDAVLVGEAWTETPVIATYYGARGDELALSFDFPLAAAIVGGVSAGEAKGIGDKLEEIRRTYPSTASDAPFLTNHDMRRVASVLGGDAGKLRSAAAVLLTLPGTPFLYYGEEVGLLNGPGGKDEEKRTPMPWDSSERGGFTTGVPWHAFAAGGEAANVATQRSDPSSLLWHYRRLIRARHVSGALRRGGLELVRAQGPLLAFLRTLGSESVLVVHNLGAEPLAASLPVQARADAPLFASEGAELRPDAGGVRVSLPPHASAVFRR